MSTTLELTFIKFRNMCFYFAKYAKWCATFLSWVKGSSITVIYENARRITEVFLPILQSIAHGMIYE